MLTSENVLAVIDIILIIGIAQGVLLAVLIFHKYSNLLANYFLGALMLTGAISLLQVYLGEHDYFFDNPYLMILLPSVIFLLGPLHYLYAKCLIYSLNKFRLIEWLHFTPFLLYILSMTPHLLALTTEGNINTSQADSYQETPSGFIFLNWAFAVHMMVYMTITIYHLKKYSIKIRDIFSNIEKIRLTWLRRITYMSTIVIIIFLGENFLNINDYNLTDFHLSSFLGAIYVYAMGYMGISKSEIFSKSEISVLISDDLMSDDSENTVSEAEKNSKKYEKSGLSTAIALEYLRKLQELMKEEEPYLDNTLTLHKLSERLSISIHHISEVINSQLNQNFFDFINQYRVDKVIEDLSNSKKDRFTLLALALDAGFNSKSTFNTIFKKQTNLTPSAYRDKLRKEGSALVASH